MHNYVSYLYKILKYKDYSSRGRDGRILLKDLCDYILCTILALYAAELSMPGDAFGGGIAHLYAIWLSPVCPCAAARRLQSHRHPKRQESIG
jgi:hypothetical protein